MADTTHLEVASETLKDTSTLPEDYSEPPVEVCATPEAKPVLTFGDYVVFKDQDLADKFGTAMVTAVLLSDRIGVPKEDLIRYEVNKLSCYGRKDLIFVKGVKSGEDLLQALEYCDSLESLPEEDFNGL